MRHADLRREATAVIAKSASALLYDTAVWYPMWVCGRVGVCFAVGLAMRWVQDTSANVFDRVFGLADPVEKVKFFDWIPKQVGKTQSKNVESKESFFDCVRMPDFDFSRKRPFSTDKSDYVRNGLRFRSVNDLEIRRVNSDRPTIVKSRYLRSLVFYRPTIVKR